MDGEAQVSTENSTPVSDQQPAASSSGRTADFDSANSGSNPEAATTEKPSGFDPVEFTPEQKARVDRIYGNMKRYESESRTLKEDNQRLLSAFEALQNDQKHIINHIQTNDFKVAETRLTSERQTAWNKGDIDAFNKSNDALLEIKAKKIVAESIPRPVQTEQPKPNGYMNGQRIPVVDVVNQAVERGEIEPQEAQIFKSWESQADDMGTKLRPWTDISHPLNQAAAIEGRAVFENPAFKNKNFAEKLREIDRRMGLQTQNSQNNSVLSSGNLTRGKSQPKVDLSPDVEQKINKLAIRSKFAAQNPKLTPQQKAALTDQDHINAYRAVLVRNQQKGGRR